MCTVGNKKFISPTITKNKKKMEKHIHVLHGLYRDQMECSGRRTNKNERKKAMSIYDVTG